MCEVEGALSNCVTLELYCIFLQKKFDGRLLLDEQSTEEVIENIRTRDIFSAKQAVFFICSSLNNDMHLLLPRLKTNLDKKRFGLIFFFSYRLEKTVKGETETGLVLLCPLVTRSTLYYF